MSCWNTISFALCSLCISVLSAARDTVPYFCGFERSEESEVQLWHSGTNPFLPDADQLKNLWYAGTAEAVEGNRSLYISADGGVSARYRGVENTVLAYRVFDLPAGTYNLAFDWKTNQFYNNSCLMVAWIDDSDRRVISTTGSDIPDVILDNHLTVSDKYGNTSDTLQAGSAWERVCATITSDGVTKKKLVFAWHNPTGADGLPGGCIDNIDIAYAACACPADIVIKKRPDGIDVSWTGTAPQYDICYKRHSDTICTTAQTAGTSFAIQQLDAGIYDIKVRSVYPDCGKSVWSECFNIFLLGATARCLDYTDLNAEGVKCYWGVFDNPRQHNQVVDFYRSQKSFHTIHYDLNEYDEITKRQLKTVPEGMLASVRLSSWQEGVGVAKAPSAAVEYPLTVTDDAKVLLLYYAAVFEHCENPEGMWKPTPAQQPYINVRILDEDGNLLTECTKAAFRQLNSTRATNADGRNSNGMPHTIRC